MIIPKSVSVTGTGKRFTLNANTTIFVANENAELAGVANYLAAEVVKATGLALPVKDASGASGKNGIQLVLTGQDAALGDEGYELTLEKDRVIITANQSWPGYFMACRRYIDLIST